jgi:hypothetical protein
LVKQRGGGIAIRMNRLQGRLPYITITKLWISFIRTLRPPFLRAGTYGSLVETPVLADLEIQREVLSLQAD